MNKGMKMLELKILEGNEFGKAVFECVNNRANRFFQLELNNIETACNDRRLRLLEEWEKENPQDTMWKYGMNDIKYQTAIEEAIQPFSLFAPKAIPTNVWATKLCPGNNGEPCMDVYYNPIAKEVLAMNVYLPKIEKWRENYYWKGYRVSLEDVTIHELLHTCGDIKHDGIVRHNLIGIEAVKMIL
jgi:hypothetical protein